MYKFNGAKDEAVNIDTAAVKALVDVAESLNMIRFASNMQYRKPILFTMERLVALQAVVAYLIGEQSLGEETGTHLQAFLSQVQKRQRFKLEGFILFLIDPDTMTLHETYGLNTKPSFDLKYNVLFKTIARDLGLFLRADNFGGRVLMVKQRDLAAVEQRLRSWERHVTSRRRDWTQKDIDKVATVVGIIRADLENSRNGVVSYANYEL